MAVAARDTIKFARRADDECIWRSVDHVAADEVSNVRFGAVWAKALTEHDPERRAKVLAFQRKVDKAFSSAACAAPYDDRANKVLFPLVTEFRALAGFCADEMEQVVASGPISKIDLEQVEQLANAMLGVEPEG